MDYGFELVAAKPKVPTAEPTTAQPMRVGDKIRRNPSTDQKTQRRQLQRGVTKKADLDKEAWGHSDPNACAWAKGGWPECTQTADVMLKVPSTYDPMPACNGCAGRMVPQGAMIVGPYIPKAAAVQAAIEAGKTSWHSADEQVLAQFMVQGNRLTVDLVHPMGFESHEFSLKSIEAAAKWVAAFDTEVVRPDESQVAEGSLTAARAAVVSGRTAASKMAWVGMDQDVVDYDNYAAQMRASGVDKSDPDFMTASEFAQSRTSSKMAATWDQDQNSGSFENYSAIINGYPCSVIQWGMNNSPPANWNWSVGAGDTSSPDFASGFTNTLEAAKVAAEDYASGLMVGPFPAGTKSYYASKTAGAQSDICPKCGSHMDDVQIFGDTLHAHCDACGWDGSKRRPSASKMARRAALKKTGMSDEATELQMYLENDGDIYRQQLWPIIKNLENHFRKGRWDHERAITGMGYAVETAAKKYHSEFGSSGPWHGVFTPAIRREVAESMVNDLESEMNSGTFQSEASLHTATPIYPGNGDVVVVGPNGSYYAAKPGDRAVITLNMYGPGTMSACFGASCFRPADGSYVSCSGGPLPEVKMEDLTYAGKTQQRFWKWGPYGPGRDQGVDYMLEVDMWEWTPPGHMASKTALNPEPHIDANQWMPCPQCGLPHNPFQNCPSEDSDPELATGADWIGRNYASKTAVQGGPPHEYVGSGERCRLCGFTRNHIVHDVGSKTASAGANALLQDAVIRFSRGQIELNIGDRFGDSTITDVGSDTVQYIDDDGWSGSMQLLFNDNGVMTPAWQRAYGDL